MLRLFRHPRTARLALLAPIRQAAASSTPIVIPARELIKEQTEYRQLPDDSQYIEKFYNELNAFHEELSTGNEIPQRSFTEFEQDPNALVAALEKFIQGKVLPRYGGKRDGGSRVVVQRYGAFLTSVKTTLVLNGGHPFIFDVLLQNKRLFDGFEKREG